MSIGTILVVSTLGAFIHGTSGEISANSAATAYLAEPMHFYWRPEAPYAQHAAQQATPDRYVP